MYKSTESIIDELWSSSETPKKAVFTPYDKYILTASLTHTKEKFDIMLSDPEDYIGFIILEKFKGGIYNITGEYRGHHQQLGFEARYGIGLEVKPKYRRRGFASSLISIGIGIAKKDFEKYKVDITKKQSQESEEMPGIPAENYGVTPEIWFEVKVCNLISDDDIKLFKKCGFDIRTYIDESRISHTEAIYNRLIIPEIRIKPEQGHEISLALYDKNFAKQLPI